MEFVHEHRPATSPQTYNQKAPEFKLLRLKGVSINLDTGMKSIPILPFLQSPYCNRPFPSTEPKVPPFRH